MCFIFERLAPRKDTILTSGLTVGELLVKPIRTGNRRLETKYRELLREPEVKVLGFDRGQARYLRGFARTAPPKLPMPFNWRLLRAQDAIYLSRMMTD